MHQAKTTGSWKTIYDTKTILSLTGFAVTICHQGTDRINDDFSGTSYHIQECSSTVIQ